MEGKGQGKNFVVDPFQKLRDSFQGHQTSIGNQPSNDEIL